MNVYLTANHAWDYSELELIYLFGVFILYSVSNSQKSHDYS